MNAETTAELLREMAHSDPKAGNAILNRRIPCNEALADHPEIQVLAIDGKVLVGLLGVINGLLLRHGSKDVIMCTTDSDGEIASINTQPYVFDDGHGLKLSPEASEAARNVPKAEKPK